MEASILILDERAEPSNLCCDEYSGKIDGVVAGRVVGYSETGGAGQLTRNPLHLKSPPDRELECNRLS